MTKNFQNVKTFLWLTILTILASVVSTLALHVFVYPSNFVPLGLEAIVTILYHYFPSVNAGYFTFILNAPLIILAWFKLDKKYVIFTLLFTALSSILLILLELVNFPTYSVGTEGRILSSIFAGVMLGVRTGIMFKMSASTGGVDIIACVVQKKMPYINTERIISIMCFVLIGASYFVYKDFSCILLSIIQLVISEKFISLILRDSREAIEVKIVTKHPEQLREDIINNLGHSATIVSSQGMYSGENNAMVFTIIDRRQVSKLMTIARKYPDTFIYYNEVMGIYGKFRNAESGKIEDR